MLNEPNPEPVPGGGGGVAGGIAGDTSDTSHMRYIQVTPQEKEAIERVRRRTVADAFPSVQSLQCDTQLCSSHFKRYLSQTGKHNA